MHIALCIFVHCVYFSFSLYFYFSVGLHLSISGRKEERAARRREGKWKSINRRSINNRHYSLSMP